MASETLLAAVFVVAILGLGFILDSGILLLVWICWPTKAERAALWKIFLRSGGQP